VVSGGWWVVGSGIFITVLVVSCGSEDGDLVIGGVGLPVTDVDVVVTSVADGDSFRADSPTGEIEVRLLDINSPELDECFGQEAREALTELIEGRTIGLATEPELDQFDRVLARAVVNGTYVNLEMVRSGHSFVVSEGSSDYETLVEAEVAARASEIGLWAGDVCGAVGPRATLEFTGIDYDPPGADDDESVTILNSGADPIGLSGFVLRDESSVNRFEFPDITLEPGRELVVARGCGDEDKATLLWCTEQPIWNNDGDTAVLLDRVGRIVALHRY
jgi:micrococcal nuclease